MTEALVIVESPAKARTINKYLGKKYKVMASMGHVRDLPKKDLGVDEDDDFKPKYQIIPSRKKVLKELQDQAKKVDAIYLAADPDREGEAICWHLAEALKGSNQNFHRVMFNEITKSAIEEAFGIAGFDRRVQGRGPAGPADPGPPGGVQAVAAALGQGPSRDLGRAGPIGRPSDHL